MYQILENVKNSHQNKQKLKKKKLKQNLIIDNKFTNSTLLLNHSRLGMGFVLNRKDPYWVSFLSTLFDINWSYYFHLKYMPEN